MEELWDKDQLVMDAESLKWWSGYAKSHLFSDQDEAYKWIARKMKRADEQNLFQSESVKVLSDAEYDKAAREIPLYQSGKSWKVGKRIQKDTRLKLSDIEVRRPSKELLSEVANANGTEAWKVVAPFMAKISDLIPDEEEDFLYKRGNEPQRMRNLADKIKENLWIETPIVGIQSKGFWLIEGQHRVRAMSILGFKTVPVIGIEYEGE